MECHSLFVASQSINREIGTRDAWSRAKRCLPGDSTAGANAASNWPRDIEGERSSEVMAAEPKSKKDGRSRARLQACKWGGRGIVSLEDRVTSSTKAPPSPANQAGVPCLTREK